MDGLIIFCAKHLFLITGLLVLLVLIKQTRKQRLQFLLTIIIAGVIAYILSKILSSLYYDPRPFVSQNITPLIPHAPDNGFPSDHAWFTSVIAACIYMFNQTYGKLAFAIVIIVGIARVMAHVHSPIDIIGGIAIGVVAAYLAKQLVNRKAKL